MEKHADTDLHILTNVCKRHLSHRHCPASWLFAKAELVDGKYLHNNGILFSSFGSIDRLHCTSHLFNLFNLEALKSDICFADALNSFSKISRTAIHREIFRQHRDSPSPPKKKKYFYKSIVYYCYSSYL